MLPTIIQSYLDAYNRKDVAALNAGPVFRDHLFTAQTASSHLAKLLSGGLVVVETEGRHRYYRLAGANVAQAMEGLLAIQPSKPVRRKALSPEGVKLQFARCCYDHLAGQAGVAVTNGLVARQFILARDDRQFDVTSGGAEWFASIGLDTRALKPTRSGLARQCLDGTERTHHLAGPLGVEFLKVLCSTGWLRRAKGSRAVLVTPTGVIEFKRQLGIELAENG